MFIRRLNLPASHNKGWGRIFLMCSSTLLSKRGQEGETRAPAVPVFGTGARVMRLAEEPEFLSGER
jgi:hypothetical protein